VGRMVLEDLDWCFQGCDCFREGSEVAPSLLFVVDTCTYYVL
jgi:hypothetical protein